jgi:hypothetical protein
MVPDGQGQIEVMAGLCQRHAYFLQKLQTKLLIELLLSEIDARLSSCS